MDEKKIWQEALERTPQCLTAENFATGLSDAEAAHVDECPLCQAERALWNSFGNSEAAADDGAAVQWIAAELQRRSSAQPALSLRQRLFGLSYGWRAAAAGVCALVLAVGVTLSIRDRRSDNSAFEPAEPVYRSTAVTAIAPVGDQAEAPHVLQWQHLPTARQYRVQVMEVDRTVLWTTTVSTNSVRLPSSVRAAALPGKTLLWQVQALGSSGEVIASSTFARFRVKTKYIPDGE